LEFKSLYAVRFSTFSLWIFVGPGALVGALDQFDPPSQTALGGDGLFVGKLQETSTLGSFKTMVAFAVPNAGDGNPRRNARRLDQFQSLVTELVGPASHASLCSPRR
jgi:hypothetical protein